MINVRVSSTKYKKASRCAFRLRLFGLYPDDYGAYKGDVRTRRRYEKLKKYCEKKRLFFRTDNEYGKRGGSYRDIYFRNNPPGFAGRYFCAYCGKLLKRKDVTIDHLYPLGLAYRDIDMQKHLKKLGISGINDPKNLVAACYECNQKKGKSTGKWIKKGRLGRHPWFWKLRWLVILFMFAAVLLIILLQYPQIGTAVRTYFPG